MELALMIISLILLAILSFFFSSADMVFAVVDKNKLNKNKTKSAKQAYKLANNYENTVSTILFGNNLVNVLMSSLITVIGINYIEVEYGSVLLVAILTIFVIIFCEFVPKAISKRFSYRFAIIYAYPILFFKYLFFIFVWPIGALFKYTVGKIFYKRSKQEEVLDEEVLSEIVDSVEKTGEIEEDEANLVQNAINLNEIEAYEIMTPRVDVYALDVEEKLADIVKDEELFVHSRIPVYEESIDNIIGFIPLKSLQEYLFKNKETTLRELVLPCLKIPHNHMVLDLLQEFKSSKVHIAVVIDEYGGTDGIITMEDILEEIVGDIFDENDEVVDEIKTLADGHYIVDGQTNIDDFFELLNIHADEEEEIESATVNGFVIDLLDRFARTGDEINYKNYHFKVLDADEYTINTLEVIQLKQDEN